MSVNENIYSRTEMMLGKDKTDVLRSSHVAIFGVCGVGGYAAEAIARAGVGKITVIDPDCISVTNINRQIIALHSTIGEKKVTAIQKRISDINPGCTVFTYDLFYSEDCKDAIDFTSFDYVIDAIDSVKSKVLIAVQAKEKNVPVISAMGAGNKLDPTRFTVTDIFKTQGDPLARAMRNALRREGIDKLKVVFSPEEPFGERERRCPGSISFVPGAVGLILAGEVIRNLTKI